MRVGVILAVALSQVPTPVSADDQPNGLEQLRGTWKVAKSEPKFEPERLVFDGGKLMIVFDEMQTKEAAVRVDTTVKPAQIDITGKRDKALGIYEVSGDTLRLCFSPKGNERPTEFKAAEGVILVTLEWQKK